MQLMQREGVSKTWKGPSLLRCEFQKTLVKDDLNYYSGRVDFRIKRLNTFKMPSLVDRMGQWVKALTTEPGSFSQIPAICMVGMREWTSASCPLTST